MTQDARGEGNMSHADDGALHAYLDGELASPERAALETHLAECPACRARLAEERALVERASQLLGLAQPTERPAPPPPLHQLRQPRLVRRLRVPLAWAASVVLALSLGYYLRGRGMGVMPQPASVVVATAEDRAGAPAAEEKAAAPLERRESNRVDRLSDGYASRAADKASSTPPPAAGVVAITPAAQLRNAAPAAAVAPSAAEPAARAEVDLAALRGRLVATEWPIIRREPARRMLGSDPVGVPGLAVRQIRRSPTGDGTVLVEQQLDSSTVIQLFQRPATAERDAFAAPAPQRYSDKSAAGLRDREHAPADRLARFVGPLRVEIAGPLSQDSLNRLLEQVKPLP